MFSDHSFVLIILVYYYNDRTIILVLLSCIGRELELQFLFVFRDISKSPILFYFIA